MKRICESLALSGVAALLLSASVTQSMADEPVAPTEQNLRNGVSIGGEITFSGGGTILLNEPVEITSDVVIDGGGQVIIDGQKLTTLFVISSPVEVTLRGLTLTKGRSKARTG